MHASMVDAQNKSTHGSATSPSTHVTAQRVIHAKSTLDNDRSPCRKSDKEERTARKPYVELREHVHGAAIGTWCQKGGGGKLVAAVGC